MDITILLPFGQKKTFSDQNLICVADIINKLSISYPDLPIFQPTDLYGKKLDYGILISKIPNRTICYGINYIQWLEPQNNTKKNKRKTAPPNIQNKKYNIFKIYLPDGQVSAIPWNPNLILSDILNKIIKNRSININLVARDLSGQAVDTKKSLAELNLREITYGTDIKSWTLYNGYDSIRKYLTDELESELKIFKIYLPDGQLSIISWDGELKISDIITKINNKYEFPANYEPKDILGNILNINLKLSELKISEITYGIDILEWIIIREKNKTKPSQPIQRVRSLPIPKSPKKIRFDIFTTNIPENNKIIPVNYYPLSDWLLYKSNLSDKKLLNLYFENTKKFKPDAVTPYQFELTNNLNLNKNPNLNNNLKYKTWKKNINKNIKLKLMDHQKFSMTKN